jgi:O-antigen ligase
LAIVSQTGDKLNKLSEFTAKIKKVNREIGNIHTMRELAGYISDHTLEKLAFFFLLIWNLTPILVMLLNTTFKQGDMFTEMMNQSTRATFWLVFLKQAGFVGCIIGLIAFLKSIFKARSEKLSLPKYLAGHAFPFLLFSMLAWSTISCLLSDNLDLSFYGDAYRNEGLLVYYSYAGIFICSYQIRSAKLLQWLLNFFVAVSSFLSLLVLMNDQPLDEFLGLDPKAAVFNNANHFGYYLCMAVVISLILILKEERFKAALLPRFICFALLSAALLQNQSFGPYLAVIVGFICLAVFIFKFLRSRKRLLIVSLAIFILVSIIMNLYMHFFLSDLFTLLNDTENILSGSDAARSAGSGRWPLWANGLQFIIERPLFGYGPDNLGARYLAAGITIDRPHNELIQFAASLGLPALLAYLSAMVVLMVSFFRKKAFASIYSVGLFCAIAAYLFSSLLGNSMYYTTPFFMILLGLLGGLLSRLPSQHLIGVDIQGDGNLGKIEPVGHRH